MAERFELGADDRFSLLSALSHDPLQRDVFTAGWLGATLVIPDAATLGRPGGPAAWAGRERVTVAGLTPAMLQLMNRPPAAPAPAAGAGAAAESESFRLDGLRRAFVVGDVLTRADVARLAELAPGGPLRQPLRLDRDPARARLPHGRGRTRRDGRSCPSGGGSRGPSSWCCATTAPWPGSARPGRSASAATTWRRATWTIRSSRRPGSCPIRSPAPALRRATASTGPATWAATARTARSRWSAGATARSRSAASASRPARWPRCSAGCPESPSARWWCATTCRAAAGWSPTSSPTPATRPTGAEPERGASASPRRLRELLAERLPDYMVPAAYVALDRLPLTATGKLDRAALPAPSPEHAAAVGAGRSRPSGPVEELLAALWTELLGVPDLGRDDDFFALGGHSLLATRLLARVRSVLGAEVSLAALFEEPTLAGLARRIEAADARSASGAVPPIVRLPEELRRGRLPLSWAQERLWFLDRLEDGTSAAYNMTFGVRLTGELAPARLAAALRAVVARHEALRSRFRADEEGRPYQEIEPPGRTPIPLPVQDLAGLPAERREAELLRLGDALGALPFDLAAGPLIRGLLDPCLGRLQGVGRRAAGARAGAVAPPHHHRRLVLRHRPAGSVDALPGGGPGAARGPGSRPRGLAAGLAAGRDPRAPARLLARPGGRCAAGARPAHRLPPAAVPALPGRAGRPRLRPGDGRADWGSSAGRSGRLRSWSSWPPGARCWRAPPAPTTWCSACRSPTAGTRRSKTWSASSPTPWRCASTCGRTTAGNPSFRRALERVRTTALGGFGHQDLPFERLVDALDVERDLSRSPLTQVGFAFQNAPDNDLELPGAVTEEVLLPRDQVPGRPHPPGARPGGRLGRRHPRVRHRPVRAGDRPPAARAAPRASRRCPGRSRPPAGRPAAVDGGGAGDGARCLERDRTVPARAGDDPRPGPRPRRCATRRDRR